MSKNKLKRKPRSKSKKVFRELCSDDVDIFTQEELPNEMSEIAVLNEKGPFHCVELDGFYQYWKSEADRGKDVKNPMTNQALSQKILNKIWEKIKKKYPKDIKPSKSESEAQYMWIDGQQEEVVQDNDPRGIENVFELDLGRRRRRRSSVDNSAIRNILQRPAFMEPAGREQGYDRNAFEIPDLDISDEDSDFDSMDNRADISNSESVEDDDTAERNASNLPPIIRNNPIENMNKDQLEAHKTRLQRALTRAHPRVIEAYQRRIRRVERKLETMN